MEYVTRRGTLNVGLRMEYQFAQALSFLAGCMGVTKKDGGSFAMRDFLLHADADETPASVDDALLSFFKRGD